MNDIPIATVPPAVAPDAGPSVPSPADGPADCSACGVRVSMDTTRIVRRLLGILDEPRRSHLIATYGGQMPDLLCASCFNTTLSVLNAGVPTA